MTAGQGVLWPADGYVQGRDQPCGKAAFSRRCPCQEEVGGALRGLDRLLRALRAREEGSPGPTRPRSTGCGLPGPSAKRRLKTKLPAGCSVAWRYHRGKWSMVNTLVSSSGVRNFLQGERAGSSPTSGNTFSPFSCFIHSHLLRTKTVSPVLVELQVENSSS